MLGFLDLSAYSLAIENIASITSGTIGLIGVIIMCYGTVKGFLLFLVYSIRKYDLLTEIRIDVAKHLSLGLEFLVAKDIIETIVKPTFDQLLILGALLVIRTAISYILSWELRGASEEVRKESEFEQSIEQYEGNREKHRKQHSSQ